MTTKTGPKKCSCRRDTVAARVWDPGSATTSTGWRRICALCKGEMLSALAKKMAAALAQADESTARRHLADFVQLANLPTKLTEMKLTRVYDLGLVDGEIRFKIERHHSERWGAVQTWSIDGDTGRVEVQEGEPTHHAVEST